MTSKRFTTAILVTVAVGLVTFLTAGHPKGSEPSQYLSAERLEKVVADAAKDFSTRYRKDFISVAEYERLVKSGERYCQIFFSYGLFGSLDFTQDKIDNLFSDPDIGWFRPAGSFNSMFLSPKGDGYSGKASKTSPYIIEGLSQFDETFNQYPIIPPVARKRAVEVYGPLNPGKVNCFSYSLVKGVPSGKCEISFSTKDGYFPAKTRLRGKGILFIEKGMITGFKLDNVEDRFSLFVNNKNHSPLTSVNDYSYEVRYTIKDGAIYPDYLVQKVKWKKPADKSRRSYFFAEVNPCLAPFGSSISTTTKVSFKEYIPLDKASKNRYSKYFKPTGAAWRVTMAKAELDPTSLDYLMNIPSWPEIRNDIESGGKSINEQNRSQTDLFHSKYQNKLKSIENLTSRDEETRMIIQELYSSSAWARR